MEVFADTSNHGFVCPTFPGNPVGSKAQLSTFVVAKGFSPARLQAVLSKYR